jgi:hypothetical protein
MRSLQQGLGKRNLLLINFDPGASLNLGAYKAFDFNNTPVTALITENPFLTSSVDVPIDNKPADLFTSSVNNPNTAYSFDNNVSLKPWTADDSANAWAGLGAFGTNGNIDFSGKPLNVYEKNNKEGVEITKLVIEHDKQIKI